MYSWLNGLKKYDDKCMQNPVKKNKNIKQNRKLYEPKKQKTHTHRNKEYYFLMI